MTLYWTCPVCNRTNPCGKTKTPTGYVYAGHAVDCTWAKKRNEQPKEWRA